MAGDWRAAANGATMASINPATEETNADVARGTADDADAAARAARAAFDDGARGRMRGSERAKVLRRIGDLILEHAHELAYSREHGSASFESYTRHKTIWMDLT